MSTRRRRFHAAVLIAFGSACGCSAEPMLATAESASTASSNATSSAAVLIPPVPSSSAATSPAATASATADASPDSAAKTEAKMTYYRAVNDFLRRAWSARCGAGEQSASGTITVSGRTITQVTGSGLEFLVGAELPAPPAEYPDLYLASSTVTFSCPKKGP